MTTKIQNNQVHHNFTVLYTGRPLLNYGDQVV